MPPQTAAARPNIKVFLKKLFVDNTFAFLSISYHSITIFVEIKVANLQELINEHNSENNDKI